MTRVKAVDREFPKFEPDREALGIGVVGIIVMSQSQEIHQDKLSFERLPENLYLEPIEYIFADHYRVRVLCRMVASIVANPNTMQSRSLAAKVVIFMEVEMPRHIADEEQDLLPRLLARCAKHEDIDALDTVVRGEHEQDQELADQVFPLFRRLAEVGEIDNVENFTLLAETYAGTQRRHLLWEDAVMLRLGRKYLTPEDLVSMGKAMAARRGDKYPG